MADTTGLRETDVVAYRRYVTETMIAAFRSVFTDQYNHERQFQELKITQKYPLVKVDYPALVIEFVDGRVLNTGVAHEEWFNDPSGNLQKWNHRRFEGTLNIEIVTLSPLDRDLMADGIVEVLSFGRLDTQLNNFFTTIYGDPTANAGFVFQQIGLNTDELTSTGNNATIAPWQPEDVLVYSTGYSLQIHGGFYNVQPVITWGTITSVDVQSYPQGESAVDLTFAEQSGNNWSNPIIVLDSDTVTSKAIVTSSDTCIPGVPGAAEWLDTHTITSHGVPSGTDTDT